MTVIYFVTSIILDWFKGANDKYEVMKLMVFGNENFLRVG